MNELLMNVLKRLPSYGEILRRIALPIQLIIALAGLVLAITEGLYLRDQLNDLRQGTAIALQGEMIHSRDQHVGLASYLLSEPVYGLEEVEWPNSTLEFVKTLQSMLLGPDECSNLQENLNVSLRSDSDDVKQYELAITGYGSHTFVFLPLAGFGTITDEVAFHPERAGIPAGPPGTESVLSAPVIQTELQVACKVDRVFDTWESRRTNQGRRLRQIYFISQSDLLVIRALGIRDQNKYYTGQFSVHQNFTDRPYFWDAIESPEESTYDPFTYRSEPYIDLGGNGLIETYSRRIQLPNGRVGVFAVDLQVLEEKNLEKLVRSRIAKLGGDVGRFSWIAGKGLDPQSQLPDDFDWFRDEINLRSSEAKLLGRIGSPPRPVRDGTLKFTIPLSSVTSPDGSRRTTRLLWLRVNLDNFEKDQLRHILLFALGFAACLGVAANIVQDYRLLNQQTRNLWESMARVMENVATPFVRLNGQNEWVSVNASFLGVLGFKNLHELRQQYPTFRDLLVHESQLKYDEVLAQSLRGRPTSEYQITMLTQDRREVDARVHGERAPFPNWWRRSPRPHRFGVIVRVLGYKELSQGATAADRSSG